MVSVCLPSDALLQHLPSYLGFSYLGRGVCLHGCSSIAQPLLLTLDKGYLLTTTLPDLQWSNRQIWPWNTEWNRAKTNRVLPRKCIVITPSSNNTREDSIHGHHQMVSTEIRLIIFFAAKDGEALYSQQKQDWELTVAQIMNSLLPNSDLNWRK